MSNTKIYSGNWITRAFPYFLILIALSGVGLTVLLKRSDLTFFSMIFVVPLIIAAIVLLVNRNTSFSVLNLHPARVNFLHLFLIGMLIFFITLIILVSFPARPVAYFILISLFSGIILWQILCQRPEWTDNLIVFEIVLLSLNLIWGVSLKYPLFFGDTDSLVHMHYIDTILKTAHVQTEEISYFYYPLYHIFNAIGSEITGLSVRTGVFILVGGAWQVAIIFSFLLFKKLSNSRTLAGIACLIFASSSQIIFYGSYAIARSLSFVFLAAWLYLIIARARQNAGFLLLSLIVMVSMIMTHHINVLLVIPMLLVAYFCQIFVDRLHTGRPLEPIFIVTFSVCCIAYMVWFAPDLTNSTLVGTIRAILRSDTSFGMNITGGYGPVVIIGAIYYSFAFLLCLLGMRVVFHEMHVSENGRTAGAFAVAGLCFLIIFMPGPLDIIPISQVMMANRLNLMVSPFVAFLAASGVVYIMNRSGTARIGHIRALSLQILAVVFLSVMTFFSTISTGNAQDNNSFLHTQNIDTPYFTWSELDSFTFLNSRADIKMPLYADYQTQRNEFSLGQFSSRYVIKGGDLSYIQDGYVFLRIGELNRKHALSFSKLGYAAATYRYSESLFNAELNTPDNLGAENKIYSDQNVNIFLIHNPGLS
jgi:uncharacterized membrane protein